MIGSLYVKATLRQPNLAAALAMVGGPALSAASCTSRDRDMVQFWQKVQPRLHPAVPKESTAVPGKKWFSGFFSIGSMQNPVLRP